MIDHLEVTVVTKQQRKILALIDRAGRAMALREILSELGPQAKKRRLREDLAILKDRGLITPMGHGRGARWKRL
ncbi:MAG: hypothetical protein OXH11_01855 [Candidatus Aminicenantes bacterium]|nr:hypothetical protein [Candidatus Aminicenantes bacterium]